MNLLIDIGNTRIKSAISNSRGLHSVQSQAWKGESLTQVFDSLWADSKDIERVIVSNVADDEITNKLAGWLSQHFAISLHIASVADNPATITCAYTNPQQLGVDRWVGLQAARWLTEDAVVVIDCGTATTVDLLTKDNTHLGGAILPGINTMRRSLAGNTAHLTFEPGLITPYANNTADAIAGGTAFALAGAIDRLAEEAQTGSAEALQYLITGGEAEVVRPLLRVETQYHPDLLLLGLAAMLP